MDFNAIINKTKNIIVSPIPEWEKISAEPENKSRLIKNYVIPLALMVAIASIVGGFIFNRKYDFSVIHIFAEGIMGFIMLLAGIYITAIVINELAPSFDAVKNEDSAFKLIIYSYAPVFVTSFITYLFPPLSFLNILGLYGLYLFWIGITPLMKVPGEKKAGYALVSILVMIGIYIILGIIFSLIVTSIFVRTGYNPIH